MYETDQTNKRKVEGNIKIKKKWMQTRRQREDSDILASCFQSTRISFDSFPRPFDKLSLVFDATLKLKISFNFTFLFFCFLALKTFYSKIDEKNRIDLRKNITFILFLQEPHFLLLLTFFDITYRTFFLVLLI